MKYKGINYDVGTKTLTGKLTRETFDLPAVTKEIEIIKNELHCNAIRISGLDIERVVKAAEVALKLGLTVWFSPTLQYSNQDNTLKYITQAAETAEKLRAQFPNLIFVAGCELSLFTSGFVEGDTGPDRIKNLFSPLSMVKNILGLKRAYNTRLNIFLTEAVAGIKARFNGQVTYASGTWEKVNWELFDMIGVDLYRASYNKTTYLKELRNYQKLNKPLAIMEFGCCTYLGADDKGAMGWAIVDWTKDIPELKDNYIRDEATQAKYLLELLNIFEAEKVPAAFAFTFISGNYVHDDDPQYDLDMAAFGIVKVIRNKTGNQPELNWLPKKAFFELGEYYKMH
jgi:hypothetical protein